VTNVHRHDLVVLGGGIVGLWTATHAARLGASVAVVEIGPGGLDQLRPSKPAVVFSARENLGAVRARNHLLGGNSKFWGGGLVRNSRTALADLYGAEMARRVYARYEHVERSLGVGVAFESEPPSLAGAPLHEIAVLPGKKRGLWSSAQRDSGIQLFLNARIVGVKLAQGHSMENVTVRLENDEEHVLQAAEFSLSMGVIDSNIFVNDWLRETIAESLRPSIGTCLHDHWSVPVASLRWRNHDAVGKLFPPKFKGGVVVGRRLTLSHGFFHIVADLDAMPPDDRVKELLRVRQQGGGVAGVAGAALRTCASPWGMLRAGAHYLAKRELFIPEGASVRLVLDFESSRSSSNQIRRTAQGLYLDWDLRDDDHERFTSILRAHRTWWDDVWRTANIDMEWLFEESWSRESIARRLDGLAVDAFHLGGGLHPDHDGITGLTECNGRLRGCSNLFVNGTSFFCRPGPGNPVLTLLARAEIYAESLQRGGAPS
jgi:choline dehydrogenase-like flavoprotein